MEDIEMIAIIFPGKAIIVAGGKIVAFFNAHFVENIALPFSTHSPLPEGFGEERGELFFE
jgi:hypothetical protein